MCTTNYIMPIRSDLAATPRIQEAESFLTAVFGQCPESDHLQLAHKRNGIVFEYYPNTSDGRLAMAQSAIAWSDKKHDVYYAVSTVEKLSSKERGTADNVLSVSAYSADWDFYDPENPTAHAAGDKNPTRAQITALVKRRWLPPTFIVHSGNGLHLHNVLTEVMPASEAMHADIKLAMGAMVDLYSHSADPSTGVANQLLRIPGTQNWKDSDNPKPVYLLGYRGERVTPADVELACTTLISEQQVRNDAIEAIQAASKPAQIVSKPVQTPRSTGSRASIPARADGRTVREAFNAEISVNDLLTEIGCSWNHSTKNSESWSLPGSADKGQVLSFIGSDGVGRASFVRSSAKTCWPALPQTGVANPHKSFEILMYCALGELDAYPAMAEASKRLNEMGVA